MSVPLRALGLGALTAGLLGCGASTPLTTADQPDSALAVQLLSLTNAARAQARVCPDGQAYAAAAPLTYNRLLGRSAQGYADLLVNSDDFPHDGVHTDVDGQTFSQRIEAAGYGPLAGQDYASGENVQGGAGSAQTAVQAWLGSAGHCANLMDPDFSELGMGYSSAANTTYQTYWVQDLGRR